MQTRTPESAEREAARVAARAAVAAGVTLAELEVPGEASELAALFAEVWQTPAAYAPVSPDLLCALAYTGQYVVTARRGGELVGGSMGFRAVEGDEPQLHSHITGVRPAAQGRQVGFAIKLHQRAWALERGLRVITWTFDPLVRRNAYFNLTKLGASVARYRVDAYGDMADGINAGHPSDRCLAEWRVSEPRRAAPTARPEVADVVLAAGDDGAPRATAPGSARAPRLAWVPEDVLAMRREQPELAREWRLALRGALLAAIEDGFAATAMTPAGWYVLEPRK